MTLTLSTPLISSGEFTAHQVETAILSQNPRTKYSPSEVRHIVERTLHWCDVFDFNADLVFSQMVHETDWFRFTGDVKFGQHNFAGLGATGGVPGHSFPLKDGLIRADGIDAGVLAVVAHHAVYRWGARQNWPWFLQQYAGEHVDPRYDEVLSTGNAGKMVVLGDYRGTWAVPGKTYPESLIKRSKQIAAFPKGDAPMAGDDARFQWTPDEHEFGYPTGNRGRNGKPILYLIIHTTEGTDSQAWLREQHQSSTHYLTDREFKPRAQHVREADAAWTAGHREYNERGINIEFEHKVGQAITPAMYTNAAETVKPILDRHGIPPVYLGRDPLKNKPGQKGIIGHGDVPPPNDHTDPTSPWSWDAFMAALTALYQTPENPPSEPEKGEREFETGFTIRGRIRDFWERAEQASVAYQGIGLPTSGEYEFDKDGKKITRQDFERLILEYRPDVAFPWDVTAVMRRDIPNPAERDLAKLEATVDEVAAAIAAQLSKLRAA